MLARQRSSRFERGIAKSRCRIDSPAVAGATRIELMPYVSYRSTAGGRNT